MPDRRTKENSFDKKPDFHYLSVTFGAGIAQLVEHYLAKVAVASSSLVARSIFISVARRGPGRDKMPGPVDLR